MKMVTTNKGKFKETREIAKKYGVELTQLALDLPEIRATLEEIVVDKARQAYEAVGEPVVCDDSGLFIDGLNDFPGEFSKFVLGKLGNSGILRLMPPTRRGAEFRCAACYFDGKNYVVKIGIAKGKIIHEERGSSGFGFDPIFLPEGNDKTFAEDFDFKMKVSHRISAFNQLFSFLSENLV